VVRQQLCSPVPTGLRTVTQIDAEKSREALCESRCEPSAGVKLFSARRGCAGRLEEQRRASLVDRHPARRPRLVSPGGRLEVDRPHRRPPGPTRRGGAPVRADGRRAEVASAPGMIIEARGLVKSFGQTPALRGATVAARDSARERLPERPGHADHVRRGHRIPGGGLHRLPAARGRSDTGQPADRLLHAGGGHRDCAGSRDPRSQGTSGRGYALASSSGAGRGFGTAPPYRRSRLA